MEQDAWLAALLAAPPIREPRVPLWVMEWTASGLFHLWLFCFGACVGSFLNVVVYRLPRGVNLAHPGSQCPRCGHAIRLWDNIPILSWLALWGRCRDCRTPISARYFWIELLVAAMFLAVAFWERTTWDLSLGWARRPPIAMSDWWPYWSRYATHVVLLTTYLGGILILGDNWRTPSRLYWPAIGLGLVLPLFWPEIRSMAAWQYGTLPAWQAGLIDGLAGLAMGVAGGLAGSVWRWFSTGEWPPFAPVSWMVSLCVVLGWQRGLAWSVPSLVTFLALAGIVWSLQSFWASLQPPATEDLPDTDQPTTDRPITDPPASEEPHLP